MAVTLKVKKGDLVQMLAGKDRGKQGRVIDARPADGKVVIENLNIARRHQKPRPILLPSTQNFNFNGTQAPVGTNMWVPGIVSNLYFSPADDPAETNGMACDDESLHEPSTNVLGLPGPCINGPAPIGGRSYDFNIFLPRNPRAQRGEHDRGHEEPEQVPADQPHDGPDRRGQRQVG